MSIAELLNYNPWTNLVVNSCNSRVTETNIVLRNTIGVISVNHGTGVVVTASQLLNCSCIAMMTGGPLTETTTVVMPTSASLSLLFSPSQLTLPNILSFSVELLVYGAVGPRTMIVPADILNIPLTSDVNTWTNSSPIALTNNTSRQLIFTYVPTRNAWSMLSV
jgi:hypothetical protein